MKNKKIIVLALVAGIVFQIVSCVILFNIPNFYGMLKRMSPKYKEYYELIVVNFKNADINRLFEITDAQLYGDYTYDISMNTKTISSKQDCFDEIMSFFIRIDTAIKSDSAKLYSEGYSLHITGEISGIDFYVTLDGMHTSNITHEILDKPSFYIETDLFVDYSLLNSLVKNNADVTLLLRSKFFSDKEKSIINKHQEENLFDLKWYGLTYDEK